MSMELARLAPASMYMLRGAHDPSLTAATGTFRPSGRKVANSWKLGSDVSDVAILCDVARVKCRRIKSSPTATKANVTSRMKKRFLLKAIRRIGLHKVECDKKGGLKIATLIDDRHTVITAAQDWRCDVPNRNCARTERGGVDACARGERAEEKRCWRLWNGHTTRVLTLSVSPVSTGPCQI
jgi:hypothetical protein